MHDDADALESALSHELRDRGTGLPPDLLASVRTGIRATPQRRAFALPSGLAVVGTAILATSVGAVALSGGFGLRSEPSPTAATAPTAGTTPQVGTVDWQPIPAAPTTGRVDSTIVWSGSQVLVWGGRTLTQQFDEVLPADGAGFDPETGTWTAIPAAPMAGRVGGVVAWGQDALYVWGGTGTEGALGDGARWNPAQGHWELLPQAPIDGGPAVGAWLRGRLVVVTDTGAAAFDPSTLAWTMIAPAPVRPGWRVGALVDGGLVVVAFGDGATGRVEAAILEDDLGAWRELELPLDPVVAGTPIVGAGPVLAMPGVGLVLDPATGRATQVAPCPGAMLPVWTGVNIIGLRATWDPADGSCGQLPSMEPFREGAASVWTGNTYLVWGGALDGAPGRLASDGVVLVVDR